MPRSDLQIRKEQERLRKEGVADSLRRGTLRVHEKRKNAEVKPEQIGAQLFNTLRQHIINQPETFNRPIKTKNPEAIKLAYALHMLGSYPVPRYIQTAFINAKLGPDHDGRVQSIDEMFAVNLFIAIRGGKSVYKEVTRDLLSKKETHTLTTCAVDLTVKEAFVYAIAMQETDRSNALRIAKSPISRNYSYGDDFWREVIRFFSRNPVSKQDLADIVDYVRIQHGQNADYSIKGRTVLTLTRAHETWVREMARSKELGTHTWAGIPYRDLMFRTRNGKHTWNMYQIKNSKELGKEGTNMRHCVLSYRPQCSLGTIGIFTLRYRAPDICHHNPEHAHTIPIEGERNMCMFCEWGKCLTIEITRDGYIRQVRGFANRLPDAFEKEAVEYWAAQNGVVYNSHSCW